MDEFWTRIKYENWQRLSVIDKELFEPEDCEVPAKSDGSKNMPTERKSAIFDNFRELPYEQHVFIKFLEENNCDKVIKEYLGFG